MTIFQRIQDLKSKVDQLENSPLQREQNAMPSNCYFLNEDEIVCYKRKFGDARYPYSNDGLTLWAYSSGNIKIEESTFNVILDFCEGKEPNLCFFMGMKDGNGYLPISLTGLASQPTETDIKRYTVYSPEAVYYFTETKDAIACVRMFIDETKTIRFTLALVNQSGEPLQTYLSAYFNSMLSSGKYEFIETKWFRAASVVKDGFLVQVDECVDRLNVFTHYGRIVRDMPNEKVYSTTSHTDYNGGQHVQLYASSSLRSGSFAEQKLITRFSDTAIEGDIIPLMLESGENFAVSYSFAISDDREIVERRAFQNCKTEEIDVALYASRVENGVGQNIPEIEFEDFDLSLNGKKLSYFLKNVCRQNEFCARAKNYAGPLIGIRDIFQQLESALMWIPQYCRGKIVEAMNYIGENGRTPRQYSYTQSRDAIPTMDLREFIDQGVWVISTVYTYLCYTNDYSILEEECGYYRFEGGKVYFSEQRDSVLEHLLRICNYLLSNVDEETNCLRILYGDWNDALDGLGRTIDEGKEFGSGVSVMATLQLCQNLEEIGKILTKQGKKELASYYINERKKIKNGLLTYAVVKNDKGERKVVHGWSDKRKHFVGSYRDNDGENRDSLTSNAFWVLSGALDWDKTQKKDIVALYHRLDSKYGLKTFEPYFALNNKEVGRIINLPKGTAENGAVYIHGTLFGVWSLFKMGETEFAWEQLVKILPITHQFISTTPFVMSNSYCYNEEFGIDGESMSDWFTGSGCVLLKIIMWQVFGVQADLDGLHIRMPKYIPFKRGRLALKVKGADLVIDYVKKGEGRKMFVNGKQVSELSFANEYLFHQRVCVEIVD